jgi:hypothetical protein
MAQLATPICRDKDGLGRSHSCSFDHRRRPETFRTAMATAFFWPTNTTSFLPQQLKSLLNLTSGSTELMPFGAKVYQC